MTPKHAPDSAPFPAPIYRDTVLAHIFADAQRLFLTSLIQIDYAHLVMLAEQAIVTPAVAAACLHALDSLNLCELANTPFDGSVEDLFFLVERRLIECCGVENAGRLHTARSRNDIDATMYRMVLRERLLQTLTAVNTLRTRLLALASEHRAALMPAYTHNQPAQPTTLGHYLMAFVEVLERDAARLRAAFARVNRNPLGACAITTTGFPINRHRTAELLGFVGLQLNSYGAIAAVDYLTESCSVLATAMLNLGRFAQDLLLWSTAEFGYLRLSDAYVQISSIMPQKRNPVPLEHVRILASRAFSEAQAVLASLHNTPFQDMNDAEDSLQPLVDLAFADGLRSLQLLEGALAGTTFNTPLMHQRAHAGFLTVTELADTLVRSTGISFHQSHAIVSAAVRASNGNYTPATMLALVQAALHEANIPLPPGDTLAQALNPEHFIAVRTIPGGPAPQPLAEAIHQAQQALESDLAFTRAEYDHVALAAASLHAAVAALKG